MNVFVVNNIATILLILSLSQYCRCQEDITNNNFKKAPEQRCESTSDCTDPDRICHENKCICSKPKPIEVDIPNGDKFDTVCTPLVLIGERCYVDEQCMGESQCMGGACACQDTSLPVFNPSNKIFYCLPLRRLEEECNSDRQCPLNAYCSVTGCRCSNGYGPQNVSNTIAGTETTECLPKTCTSTDDCGPFHQCDDNKCKCLPTHFDINQARCFQYHGKSDDLNLDQNSSSTNTQADDHHNNHQSSGDIISIFKDLTSMTSDKLWLVLIILIILSLLLLILILSLLRKHYLGYCWTAHKKEYEPNTAKQQAPRNGQFDKNSINNKSFRRRKEGELDEDEADENDSSSEEDKSNLVANKNNHSRGDFVSVNLKGGEESSMTNEQTRLNNQQQHHHHHQHQHQHQQQGPLKSSTSTPV